MSTASSLSLSIAAWFDARIGEGFLPHSALRRLYTVDVLDPTALDRRDAGAARMRYVGEAVDGATLEEMAGRVDLADVDGAVVVSTRWVPCPEGPLRPGGFTPRRRARMVQVATQHGASTVVRFDDDPHLLVLPAA